MKLSILGNGVFGKAMGSYFSSRGHEVLVDEIQDSKYVFVCVASGFISDTFLKVEKELGAKKIIICSKGFAGDGKLISKVLKDKFGIENNVFFLYGPTIAEEILKGIPSGMVLAGEGEKEEIKKQIESENLKIDLSDDPVGVEICAAFKNFMNILIGITEGVNCAQNTKALILTRIIQEMKNVGIVLGAKPDTFLGLACIGDLNLSSRNRIFGIEIGKGRTMREIIDDSGYTPEGIFALKDAKIMLDRTGINAPITKLLYRTIFEAYPVDNLIKEIIF